MAKGTRICKICGVEYEYCRTDSRIPGVFRWQDVACCSEHGAEYLHLIKVSRGEITEAAAVTTDTLADIEADTASYDSSDDSKSESPVVTSPNKKSKFKQVEPHH